MVPAMIQTMPPNPQGEVETAPTCSLEPNASSLSHIVSILPPELYSHIIEQTDDITILLSILITCKFISSEVERKLYRTIKLNSPKSHRSFLYSILNTKRSHLPGNVRHYYLSNAPFEDDSFNILLKRGLVTFVNLTHLSFWGNRVLPSARVLPSENPPPFQLHSFQWHRGTDQACLGPFLDSQNTLEELVMYVGGEEFSLSTSSLPHLRGLTGSTKAISKILPGRDNIVRLQWNPLSHYPFNPGLIPLFSHIRILSLGLLGIRPLLGSIIQFLEHIEILRVGSLSKHELVDLYKLKHLRALVITSSDSPWKSGFNFSEAFYRMKNLESVDLPVRRFLENKSIVVYQRWSRGVEEPIVIDEPDEEWWKGFVTIIP